MACFGNTLILILYALYWCFSDAGYKRILKIIFEFFITFYALAFVYVALQACEIWKRTFLNLIGICRARVLPISHSVSASSVAPNYHNFARTSKGEQMIFSAAQEGELYFLQLNSTWS
uniref:Uncharacterized protein n=1 Tax=Panagrolaimus sp. PS1159 TaxID=55785 RepID=A0AC35FJ86_9BILA